MGLNLNGGTLELNSWVNQSIDTSATLRFNSGILKARQSTTHFIPSDAKLEVMVQNGGALIDTNNFDVTIHEPLLEDSGSIGGGLTKNGGGLLTLAATITITGGTPADTVEIRIPKTEAVGGKLFGRLKVSK